MAGQITVRGLREFERTLRKIERNAPGAARTAGADVAQLVVRKARPRVPIGPAARGHAKTSLRVQRTPVGAHVVAGGRRYPYFPWLDRGGAVGRNDSIRRRFVKQGRYIWPAYLQVRGRAQSILAAQLARIARSAGGGR